MLLDKEYISYIGMCNNIPQLLANSNLFICSSVTEAGPITIYEAMSMKLPVVTTDVGASRQIIENFKNGVIVPTKNSLELYIASDKILNDNFLSKKISNAAFMSSKNLFSVDIITKRYIEFYIS